ncbi:TadE-like protein [Sphingomonas laterariae]|uniref:TadE-like protein n=1 Tax=Edaphosphingomonas laterariae TaxID=861865 RepID=A0A239HMT9_9SPHN|nr:TadE/TadG family type IV pilus assembly protein [Sphingomonas laterariae]SNS82398.1 TadE-like protein [Sphingomonas laterariae]
MRLRHLHRRIREDRRGIAAVEFALVALPLCGIILALFDFGYRMYLGSVIEGTLHRAARNSAIGNLTAQQVDDYIDSQLESFSNTATIEIEKKSYYEYSGIGKPEKIKQDTDPLGEYNVGDCYEDLNGNGIYDSVAGRTGLGGSDDIVYYKVTATYNQLMPLTKIFGFSSVATVSRSTVLRNQPFAAQTIPTVKCT